MESLTSPKITVGLHCLRLRTKSMYVTSVVDPAEATFYDSYESGRVLVRRDPERLRAGRASRSGPMSAAAAAAAAGCSSRKRPRPESQRKERDS